MANSHRLRIGRYSGRNQIYLITTVCWRRQPVFTDFSSARTLVGCLRDVEPSATTLCYVVMPEHLHWLMQLRQGAELSATVRLLKSLATRRIRGGNQEGPKVWQRGFHDRLVLREEDLQDIARYLVANPLRAGLVSSVRDYSHWDAIWI